MFATKPPAYGAAPLDFPPRDSSVSVGVSVTKVVIALEEIWTAGKKLVLLVVSGYCYFFFLGSVGSWVAEDKRGYC